MTSVKSQDNYITGVYLKHAKSENKWLYAPYYIIISSITVLLNGIIQ